MTEPRGEPSPVEKPSVEKPRAERLSAEERRRRRAVVFGEVLPESTGDDRDEPGAPGPGSAAIEEWLRRQVPPHHG